MESENKDVKKCNSKTPPAQIYADRRLYYTLQDKMQHVFY